MAAAMVSFVGVWAVLYGGRGYVRAAMLYGNASYHQMGLRRFEGGLVRIAVLALGMLLVVAFLQLVPRKRSLITALGATTLSVYVWHALAVRNIKFYDLGQLFTGSLVAVILATAVMVVVFGWGPIPSATAWLTGARWPKGRRSHNDQ